MSAKTYLKATKYGTYVIIYEVTPLGFIHVWSSKDDFLWCTVKVIKWSDFDTLFRLISRGSDSTFDILTEDEFFLECI